MGEKKTNYDKTREDAEQRFLAYDQEKMIRKFQLEADEAFLYLRFVGRDYRINRKNGKIEWNRNRSEKIGFVPVAAGFEETLSILDVLCCSKEDCHLSGNFHTIDRMKSTRYAAAPGAGLYASYEKASIRIRESSRGHWKPWAGSENTPEMQRQDCRFLISFP